MHKRAYLIKRLCFLLGKVKGALGREYKKLISRESAKAEIEERKMARKRVMLQSPTSKIDQ